MIYIVAVSCYAVAAVLLGVAHGLVWVTTNSSFWGVRL